MTARPLTAEEKIASRREKGVRAKADRDAELHPQATGSKSLPERLPGSLREFGRVATRSAAMGEVFDMLERFAMLEMSITLVGETGAGKDVLAHAIHEHSPRAGGPFVVFDCGAVTATLAESELLGHERGAFTGAVSSHAGAFERAHGGTLFLDEIGELPLELQPRLLRALESRKVRRVGGQTDRAVDVRIIAATNRNLQTEVAAGRFREDLYFRLAVAVVRVPPLRKRKEDLPDLVAALLADLGRADLSLSEAALQLLRGQSWPGNVRELKNVISCALAFLEPTATAIEPSEIRTLESSDGNWIEEMPLGAQALERLEYVAIKQTMVQTKGNKVEAARSLGIAPSTLYEKLKKYGL
jgi:DNA-binding NtrC family response regulator